MERNIFRMTGNFICQVRNETREQSWGKLNRVIQIENELD
jgi:hypothetical protein